MEPPRAQSTSPSYTYHDTAMAKNFANQKEKYFQEIENDFLHDRSETNYITLLATLSHSGQFDKLAKVLDEYTTPDLKKCSLIFWAQTFFFREKNSEGGSMLALHLNYYPYSAEGLFLAAHVLVKHGIIIPCRSAAPIIIASIMRGHYEEAAEKLKGLEISPDLGWIELLLKVSLNGFDQECRQKLLTNMHLPRCAMIYLLKQGIRCDELEDICEKKLALFPYDYPFRAALMLYYLHVKKNDEADYHFEIYKSSHPPQSQALFDAVEFCLISNRRDDALKLLDTYRPSNELAYIKTANFYNQLKAGKKFNECVKEGLKKYPRSTSLMIESARNLHSREKSEKAQAVYDRILKINPIQRDALIVKASQAESFKMAKKYIELLEKHYPDDHFVTSVCVSIRYDFNEEIPKAFHDAEKTWLKCQIDITTKNYIDLLLRLKKYEKLLQVAREHSHKFPHLYIFRVFIALIRTQRLDEAEATLKTYESVADELTDSERNCIGELFVSLDKIPEAYPYFKAISPKADIETIKAYLKCLKILNKGDEARTFYMNLDPSVGVFVGEFQEWIRSVPVVIRDQAKVSRTIAAAPVRLVEDKKEEVGEELVRPSLKSISFMKKGFSKYSKEGVNPLYRAPANSMAEAVMSRNFVSYPDDFLIFLNTAISSLVSLRECFDKPNVGIIREASYYLIQFLHSLEKNPEAAPIISARVISFESIQHSLSLMRKYPFLMTPSCIRTFAQECIRLNLEKALRDSKTSFSNVDDFSTSPVKDPIHFNKMQAKDKKEAILNFIRNELRFIDENETVNFHEKDSREIKILIQAAWNIRYALRAMHSYDLDAARELRELFPEFSMKMVENGLELDGICFEMVIHIFLESTHKLDKIKLIY